LNIKKSFFIILIFFLSSCKVGRFVVYNFADIKDYKKFPNRVIENKSDTVFNFSKTIENIDLNHIRNNFDDYLTKN